MTTNVSEWTEMELRSFADRIVTAIVGHSEQARVIKRLEEDLAEVRGTLAKLSEQNATYQRDAQDATTLASDYARERDEARANAANISERNKVLVEQNSALRNELAAVRDAKEQVEYTLRGSTGRVSVLEEHNNRLREERDSLIRESDAYHLARDEAIKAGAAAKEKLAKITELLNPPAVPTEPAPVEPSKDEQEQPKSGYRPFAAAE